MPASLKAACAATQLSLMIGTPSLGWKPSTGMRVVGSPYSGLPRPEPQIVTGLEANCFAFLALQRITAPAPSLVAQISNRRSGLHTIGEARTSSSVNSFW